MSRRDLFVMRNRAWIVLAVLLAMPSLASRAAASSAFIAAPQSASGPQSQASADADRDEEASDMEQDRQDQEQEKRDREQEARDREQEKRDREEEKRDREQERLDRLSELYENGREALDEDRYDRAEAKFDQLAQLNGPQTDAALYWKAYAENRLGKRDTALASIAELKRRFPQSRWQKDASALEIEVRQSSGNPVHPEGQKDDELRMLALHGIMNSDPDRAIPLLGKVLESGSASPKERSQALFQGTLTGVVRLGTKRLATGPRGSGQDRARPEQSRLTKQGHPVPGDVWWSGVSQDPRGSVWFNVRPIDQALHTAGVHDRGRPRASL